MDAVPPPTAASWPPPRVLVVTLPVEAEDDERIGLRLVAPPLGTERASFGAAKGAGDAAETADSNVARRRQEERMVPMHPANFNGATEQLDRMRCAHAVNGAVASGRLHYDFTSNGNELQ